NDNLVNIEKQLTTLFYRLEIVNKDGSKSYSVVKSINLFKKNLDVSIYPNPVKDKLIIQYNNLHKKLNNIYIINNIGIKKKFDINSQNSDKIELLVSTFANGIYYLQLVFDNEILNRKILINN
ncbi:MAG: T9SS type A sorting domain-containing protein, partial [Dolichospermum sp.]